MIRDRFPGLRAFEETDAAVFYGRLREKQALFDLIMVERSVLLFAKSGAGKTSLLRAGIAPMLPVRRWQAVFIRLNRREQSLIQQTIAQIAQVFGVSASPGQSLWEYLQALNDDTGSVTPVLFFDQFEEIFTLYEDTPERRVFIEQLAAVVNETLPPTVQARLQSDAVELSDAQRLALEKPPRVKVVFAIRSDMLRYMHELSDNMPGILRNRFELKGLSLEKAAEAILKPAAAVDASFECPPFEFAPDALQDILQNLSVRRPDQLGAEAEIESFQLQLLCSHLERQMLEAHRRGIAPLRVEISTYGGHAGIERLLSDFYQNTLDAIPDEPQRRYARRAVEDELVKNERRISVAEASLTQGDGPVSPETLHLLVDKRLLRREERPGLGNYYELTHDTLLPPILAFRQERALREAAEKARRERDIEARKRRRLLALATAFGLLALIALGAFLYAQKQKREARLQQQKAQVNFLLAESKLQNSEDHSLAFRLAQEAWKMDTAHTESVGCMIRAFYGDLFQQGDTLYGTPHYREFDAAWARPVPGSKRILLLAPDRRSILLLTPDADQPDTFPTVGMPEIADASVAPDGRTLVTVHPGDSIARWWGGDRNIQPKLLIHHGFVLSVAFSPDGQYFTTNAADETQRLWSARGELLATYRNVSTVDLLHTAAFSPESRQLLVLEDDQTLKLYPLPVSSSARPLVLKEPKGAIVGAAFSSNGACWMMLCAGADGVVHRARIMDWKGQVLSDQPLPVAGSLLNTAVPSQDGKRLLLAASDSTVSLWNMAEKKCVPLGTCTERHTHRVNKAVFAPGEQLMASASADQTVRLWQNGRLSLSLSHRDRVEDLFFPNDASYLVATTAGNKVRLWSLKANAIIPFRMADSPIFSAITAGSKSVYAKDLQGQWYSWNMDGQRQPLPLWLQGANLFHAVPWGDGQNVLIQRTNGELERHGLQKGGPLRLGIQPCSDLTPVVAVKTNLIALCRSDSVSVLQADGRPLASLPHPGTRVTAFCWSPDGQSLFIALENAQVERWSLATETVDMLQGLTKPVASMANAMHGKSMLFGIQGAVYRWDGGARLPEAFLSGRHNEGSDIIAMAGSPDGRFIATAALDRSVVLWNQEGRWLHTFRLSETYGAAYRLHFSDDGRYLLTEQDRKVLFRWPLHPALLERALDRQSVRPLSPAERIMYDLK